MRVSESICLLFLSIFIILAVIRPLSRQKRLRVIILGIAGIFLLWIGMMEPFARDFIPALIMLIVYWQGGSFFSGLNEKLQTYLERFDEAIFSKWRVHTNLFLEIAYFFCYPMVPSAIIVLYVLNLGASADFLWTVVLPPTLLCHLFVSFYPTTPPWKNQNNIQYGSIRKLNFLVIRHASIQLNTFPSAHVASSMAIAMAMLHLHLVSGLIFLFLAISIATATVIGRYHYLADAILGFFLALCWYAIAILLL